MVRVSENRQTMLNMAVCAEASQTASIAEEKSHSQIFLRVPLQ